jgi:outer membrane cobalamin receptor
MRFGREADRNILSELPMSTRTDNFLNLLTAVLAALSLMLASPPVLAQQDDPPAEPHAADSVQADPANDPLDELLLELDDDEFAEIDLGESTVAGEAVAVANAAAQSVSAPALRELSRVISSDEIANSGASDLAELLGRESGIRVSEYLGGTTINYQGLPGKFTTILVDGQRVPGNILEQHDLSQIALGSLDSVEIISGPRAVAFGADNAGVVINLRTRGGAGHQAHMELGYGSLNWNREHFRLGNGDDMQNWLVSIEHQSRDAWDNNSVQPDTDLNSFDNFGLRGRWDFRLSNDDTMVVSADWFSEDGRGLDYSPPSLLRPSDLNTTRFGGSLGWTHQLNSGSSLVFSQSYGSYSHGLHRYFEGSEPRDERTEFEEQTLDTSLRWDNQMVNANWSLGLQRESETLSSDRIKAADGSESAESELYGLYGTYDWDMTPDWTLSLAARLNSHSEFGEVLLPAFGLSHKLDRYSTLAATAGRGYRAPSLRERFYDFPSPFNYTILGNQNLVPEKSWNYGLDYSYAKNGRSLRASLFHNEIDNLIDFNEVSAAPQIFQLENFAGVTTQGASIGLEQRWRTDAHHGDCARHWFGLGYDLTWLEEASVAETGLRLVNSPEFDQGLRAFYEEPGFNAELLLRRHSAYWFDADNTVEVPSQDSLNLSLARQLGSGRIKLSGLNLLDERNVRFGPLPGRELRLEYGWDF